MTLAVIIWLFRGLYLLSLLAVCGCTLVRACRVFTNHRQRDDLPCLIFFGLALNRIWFLARGTHFGQPIDQRYEGESLLACYVFAIIFETLVCVWWWWLRQGERR